MLLASRLLQLSEHSLKEVTGKLPLNLSANMANVAAKYLLLITLTGMFSILGVLCQTEPSASQVQSAFVAAKLVPDILDLSDIDNLEFLSVSFDSGVSANLGNSLRPEQIKNPQQVKWNADNSSYYMLLMIGKFEYLRT